MKLDYIENFNAYGDHIVRLYDFDMAEAKLFTQALSDTLDQQKPLPLAKLRFIKSRNCSLTMLIHDEDEGIVTEDGQDFYCKLTVGSYKEMIKLLQPFCLKATKGHQFLYDVDSQIDMLFSPGGTW